MARPARPGRPAFPSLLGELRFRFSPIQRFYARAQQVYFKGISKGVVGGNRPWLIAFLTFRGLVGLKRAVSRREERITIDLLKPGERMLIRTIPVSSGKERKRLLRGG
jgi:hypothetical protein